MPIVEPRSEYRIDIDLPVEERLMPIHVPEHIERYALRLAKRYGGDVEEWILQCLVFNVRLLLRYDRSDEAWTHAVHASVDAETYAAVHGNGKPEEFVRRAIREKLERNEPADIVEPPVPATPNP